MHTAVFVCFDWKKEETEEKKNNKRDGCYRRRWKDGHLGFICPLFLMGELVVRLMACLHVYSRPLTANQSINKARSFDRFSNFPSVASVVTRFCFYAVHNFLFCLKIVTIITTVVTIMITAVKAIWIPNSEVSDPPPINNRSKIPESVIEARPLLFVTKRKKILLSYSSIVKQDELGTEGFYIL